MNSYYNSIMVTLRSIMDTTKEDDEKVDLVSLKKTYYKLQIKKKNKINDFFNKIVKYLYNEYNGLKDYIIIGYNLNWKKGISLGKRTNRNFYNINYTKII